MTDIVDVLLVDSQPVIRDGLASRIAEEADLRVVGMAGDAETAIRLAAAKQPDVLLIEINLPGLSGFEAIETIQTRSPRSRVLILSSTSRDRDVGDALRIGVSGYILKTATVPTILDAIRKVAQGETSFCTVVKSRIVSRRRRETGETRAVTRLSTLTRRELFIVRYLARGMSVKDIAETIHVSAKTVDNHKTRIMAKLDLHNRVELSRYAAREGLVEP